MREHMTSLLGKITSPVKTLKSMLYWARSYLSRPTVKEILLEAEGIGSSRYRSLLYVLRLAIFSGIILRFIIHRSEQSKLQVYVVMLLLVLYACYMVAIEILRGREAYKNEDKLRRFVGCQVAIDIISISAFSYLTGKVESDFYLFYFLPLFVAGEQFEKNGFLVSLVLVNIAQGLVAVLLDWNLDIIPRILLPRGFFLSVISAMLFMFAQYSLKNLLQAFRTVLNAMNRGVTIVDRNSYDIVFANDRRPGLIRKGRGESRKCYSAIHSRDEKCEDCPMNNLKTKGMVSQIRTRSINGEIRVFQMDSTYLPNIDGKVELVLKVDEDITERHNLIEIADILTQEDPRKVKEILGTIAGGVLALGCKTVTAYKISKDRKKLECILTMEAGGRIVEGRSHALIWEKFVGVPGHFIANIGDVLPFSDITVSQGELIFPLLMRSIPLGLLVLRCGDGISEPINVDAVNHVQMYANHMARALHTARRFESYEEIGRISKRLESTESPMEMLSILVEGIYSTNIEVIGARVDILEGETLRSALGSGIWKGRAVKRCSLDCKILSLGMAELPHECTSFASEDEPCGRLLKDMGYDAVNMGRMVCYGLDICGVVPERIQGVLCVQLRNGCDVQGGEILNHLMMVFKNAQGSMAKAKELVRIAQAHKAISQKEVYRVRSLELLVQIEELIGANNSTAEEIKHLILKGLTVSDGMSFTRAMLFEKNEDDLWHYDMGIGPINGEEAHSTWTRIGALTYKDSNMLAYDLENHLNIDMKHFTITDLEVDQLVAESAMYRGRGLRENETLLGKICSLDRHLIIRYRTCGRSVFLLLDNAFKSLADPFLFDEDVVSLVRLYTKAMTQALEELENEKKMAEKYQEIDTATLLGLQAGEIMHDLKDYVNVLYVNKALLADKIVRIMPMMESAARGELHNILVDVDGAIEETKAMTTGCLEALRDAAGATEVVSVNECIESAIATVKMFFPHLARTVDIVSRYDGIVKVRGIRRKYETCFKNIIKNACEARMTDQDRMSLEIFTESSDGGVRIIFHDNGCGIKKEDIAKILEPQFTTKIYGKGIGLYLAGRYIEDHEGTITVESEVGVGTTFTITLSECVEAGCDDRHN